MCAVVGLSSLDVCARSLNFGDARETLFFVCFVKRYCKSLSGRVLVAIEFENAGIPEVSDVLSV